MERLIDANALTERLMEFYDFDKAKPYGGLSEDAIAAISAIDNAPTIAPRDSENQPEER